MRTTKVEGTYGYSKEIRMKRVTVTVGPGQAFRVGLRLVWDSVWATLRGAKIEFSFWDEP